MFQYFEILPNERWKVKCKICGEHVETGVVRLAKHWHECKSKITNVHGSEYFRIIMGQIEITEDADFEIINPLMINNEIHD